MFTKFSNPLHKLAQKLKPVSTHGNIETNKNRRKNHKVIIFGSIITCSILLLGSGYFLKHKKTNKQPVIVLDLPTQADKNIKPATMSVATYVHFDKVMKRKMENHVSDKSKRTMDIEDLKVTGIVKDENSNGIGSAEVLLYKEGFLVAQTYTSSDGKFTFSNVSSSIYNLRVLRMGYKEFAYPDFEVAAKGEGNIEIDLELAVIEFSKASISANQPQRRLSCTETSTSISQKQLIKTGQRSFRSLATHTSGVTRTSSGSISGRGSRTNGTAYFVDGVRVFNNSLKLNTKRGLGYGIIRSIRYGAKRLFWGKRLRREHMIMMQTYNFNTESYASLVENEYKNPFNEPLSTFSIDVDNASYTNTRRMIEASQLPPKDAVRIEEFINYFDYNYPQPKEETPFSITLETASCPWNKDTRLVHIGLKGKDIEQDNLPPNNLVFLVDVSGSMDAEDRLPLVKQSLNLLVNKLRPQDRIAIVAYAGAAGLVLESTYCTEKKRIKQAIDDLNAGGSTAGGEGIILAYKVAKENMKADGNNRIILVTDGDFNVGVSSDNELKTLIEDKRKDGIFLTVCGFGMGNYKDSKMETLADYGNGNYYYIDNFKESNKVFSKGLTGTLFTIAKDVKIQVEFNPKFVKAYRLIGYENRLMAAEDFANDAKDAGELGAGHTVTAMYEIIPAGSSASVPGFIELKYQEPKTTLNDFGDEMLTIKLRYKMPKEYSSNLLVQTLTANTNAYQQASDNFRYACGVVVYGMMLRDSKFKVNASYDLAKELLISTKLNDENGYKAELIALVEKAKLLSVPK